jgi:hypothetical protein
VALFLPLTVSLAASEGESFLLRARVFLPRMSRGLCTCQICPPCQRQIAIRVSASSHCLVQCMARDRREGTALHACRPPPALTRQYPSQHPAPATHPRTPDSTSRASSIRAPAAFCRGHVHACPARTGDTLAQAQATCALAPYPRPCTRTRANRDCMSWTPAVPSRRALGPIAVLQRSACADAPGAHLVGEGLANGELLLLVDHSQDACDRLAHNLAASPHSHPVGQGRGR